MKTVTAQHSESGLEPKRAYDAQQLIEQHRVFWMTVESPAGQKYDVKITKQSARDLLDVHGVFDWQVIDFGDHLGIEPRADS